MTLRTILPILATVSIAGIAGAYICGTPSTCQSQGPTAMLASNKAAAGKDIVQTATAAGNFNTLLAAAKAAGLADALAGSGPLTVFAPTDEAFAKLPKRTVESLLKPENREQLASLLKYHVVAGALPARLVTQRDGVQTLNGQRVSFETNGSVVRVDSATVVKTDIACSNGVIHVIDSVIMPESGTIVDVAKRAGTFSTLIAAATAAGLAEPLMGKAPLTVLAPTDEAFAKLPKGTVESLLKSENREKLAAILKYHVIAGRVDASAAVAAGSAETLNGQNVMFDISQGRVRVNGAGIVATDVDASNGVIHVIDAVILPE